MKLNKNNHRWDLMLRCSDLRFGLLTITLMIPKIYGFQSLWLRSGLLLFFFCGFRTSVQSSLVLWASVPTSLAPVPAHLPLKHLICLAVATKTQTNNQSSVLHRCDSNCGSLGSTKAVGIVSVQRVQWFDESSVVLATDQWQNMMFTMRIKNVYNMTASIWNNVHEVWIKMRVTRPRTYTTRTISRTLETSYSHFSLTLLLHFLCISHSKPILHKFKLVLIFVINNCSLACFNFFLLLIILNKSI